MNNIYLIGMPGSGKTSTAKALAKNLDKDFFDLDEEMVRQHGAIADIFQKKGENYFRSEETKILHSVTALEGKVISTGGGIVIDENNRKLMKKDGKVIYLETSFDWLWKRVKDKAHRPLLNGDNPKASLENIYNQRKKIYEDIADISINTDGKTPEQVAEEIAKKL